MKLLSIEQTAETFLVKELRKKTGAAMIDCKTALADTGGDTQKAVDILRQKCLAARVLTIDQVGVELNTSRQSVQRMIDEGILPAFVLRAGKRKKAWRVRRESLDRWILAQERQAAKVHVGRNGNQQKTKGESYVVLSNFSAK